jgi:predicted DNA-binding antitoxin AbrB/MazE fold protein
MPRVKAIYKNGVLHPIHPIDLEEGEQVELVINLQRPEDIRCRETGEIPAHLLEAIQRLNNRTPEQIEEDRNRIFSKSMPTTQVSAERMKELWSGEETHEDAATTPEKIA